jgi:serine protein kinase
MEKTALTKYSAGFDRKKYLELNQEMSYDEYIAYALKNPKVARNAFQYIYDMIISKGTSEFERYRKTYTHYNFFDDPKIPIYGLEETLDQLVNFIHGAAGGYGTEKRVLLLHGPVGSAKSTICRLLKKGLEEYSRSKDGAWYSYKWVNLPTEGEFAVSTTSEDPCPLHEEPSRLMDPEQREAFFADLNLSLAEQSGGEAPYTLRSEGEMCPRCKTYMKMLLKKYDGDWEKVVREHIRVVRLVHSEIDRVGIGTFQPKDEKNQDSTELTGDLNFGKVSHYGSDSDSRAFNFDGEFCVANRGVMEFIEMLKLSNEFLYDLLGASQEHNIKPKKFPQVKIDQFIVGHTNHAELERLQGNRFMEALRDRTVKIDVPYLLRWSDEIKVLESDYGPGKVKQHIMPHTLEIAALFAILTRLKDDKDVKLDLRDKAKLYDGRALPGWTEDSVKELRDKYPTEGLDQGVSARYIQDKISNCLARSVKGYVNVFHVLNELKAGFYNSSMIDVEHIKKYEEALDLAIKELQEILKAEVQKALVADENIIERVCAKYIDNVVAYVNKEKIINPITKQPQEPDERLMRSIEEKIDIPEQGANDFRRSLASFIGTLTIKKKEFKWDSNPELRRALEAKVFEDTRDSIKLSALTGEAAAADPDSREKLEAIKVRLINQYGYNEQSATDVLEYVASLFTGGTD